MADVNSVKLPLGFPEKRALRLDRNHLNGRCLEPYDLAQYDNDTIFYDVFCDIRNRFLYTIGPPFLNLKKFLFPITCRINDDKRKHELKIIEYLGELIAIGKIPLKGLPVNDENRIEFNFNGYFQWDCMVNLNRHEIRPVILTTIQKNNSIQWIKEWVEFYSRKYKINQAIIYDNDSCNRDDLKKIAGENLLIIPWDFKYGPIRSHPNQYCQLGSLNHCRLKFGSNNIIMNFDIDELLYLKKSDWQDYISDKYNLVLFNGYRVPFIKPASEDYSYSDFSFRDSEPQGSGRKYFYVPDNIIVNDVHKAVFKTHKTGIYRRLWNIYNNLCVGRKKGRLYYYITELISKILRLKIVTINDAYFLHYTGITTNWKSVYWDRKIEISDTSKLVKFDISKPL